MKIFYKTLQVLLALWSIMGGVYMMSNYSDLASMKALALLPAVFWVMLAIVQIVLAVGLLASTFVERFRTCAKPSALGLAGINLSGLFLYSAYAGLSGMLWAVVPAVLFLLIAYRNN